MMRCVNWIIVKRIYGYGLWFLFAVLQVLYENKSTATHSTQFMVCTEERCVLYLYIKYEA